MPCVVLIGDLGVTVEGDASTTALGDWHATAFPEALANMLRALRIVRANEVGSDAVGRGDLDAPQRSSCDPR